MIAKIFPFETRVMTENTAIFRLSNPDCRFSIAMAGTVDALPSSEDQYDVKTLHLALPQGPVFGRLVRGNYHTAEIPKAVEISRSILPMVKAQPGFVGVFLLVKPDGQNFSVSLWENQSFSEFNIENGWWRKRVDDFADVYTASPITENYVVEIAVGAKWL